MEHQKNSSNDMIKPLSRFVEHFDMVPPSELLDTIDEEQNDQQQQQVSATGEEVQQQHDNKSQQQQDNKNNSYESKKKQPIPLYALPEFSRQKSDNIMDYYTSAIDRYPQSRTFPTTSSSKYVPKTLPSVTSNSRGISNYLGDKNNSVAPVTTTTAATVRNLSKSKSSPLLHLFNPNDETTNTISDVNKFKTRSFIIDKNGQPYATISNASSTTSCTSHNDNNRPQQQLQLDGDFRLATSKSTTISGTTTTKRLNSRGGNKSLNRADLIIKRYESWAKLITLLSLWLSEISKLSQQSEKSYQSLLRDTKFASFSSRDDTATLFKTLHGFTKDLAQQATKFGQSLQKDYLSNLEKLKKESAVAIKALKMRQDLNIEEYLKRAQVTASLIVQLTKSCKEARRNSGAGSQVTPTNDPWLINLYALRQMKREVDEENRLRKLMIPIQDIIIEFETRLLKAVQDTLEVCFDKLGSSLTQEQLDKLQSTLNQAADNDWESFAARNKEDIVNQRAPLKHYLNINYSCKNDPLVMTLYNGQMERRTGVLSKYSAKFFVLTESGFLHQFKLNDKVSPEFSIYLPKSTIIPGMDIRPMDIEAGRLVLKQQTDQQQQQQQQQKKRNSKYDGYSFELHQRSISSVLQRDKSYVFRTASLEELVIWCKLLTEIATRRPPESISRSISKKSFVATSPQQQLLTPTSPNISSFSEQQQQQQERTPPPSPINKRESCQSILTINDHNRSELPSVPAPITDDNYLFSERKPKFYTAQLNI